ncbi:MAG: hypothetical protein ACXV7G_12085 [Halobacteriota archaeon]
MMTIQKRIEKLEARKPLPALDNILSEPATFAMDIFERVCVPCPDRLKYPKCPRCDCSILMKELDDECANLDAEEPHYQSLIEGVEVWKAKWNRSEWLAAGFHLFAYEDRD